MSKISLQSVTTNLASLAEPFPTQKPQAEQQSKIETPVPQTGEPVIQFSLSMRKSLRKELMRLADDADMTMRAFVLNALKEKGLSVIDDDLADKRKK